MTLQEAQALLGQVREILGRVVVEDCFCDEQIEPPCDNCKRIDNAFVALNRLSVHLAEQERAVRAKQKELIDRIYQKIWNRRQNAPDSEIGNWFDGMEEAATIVETFQRELNQKLKETKDG